MLLFKINNFRLKQMPNFEELPLNFAKLFVYSNIRSDDNKQSTSMPGSRGGDKGFGPPLKNHKNIGFLSNTGPDPLKNHKATKPALNVGPASARQQNVKHHFMVFRWRTDDGPLIVVFGSFTPPPPPIT